MNQQFNMTTDSESYYSAPSPNPSVESGGDRDSEGTGKKKKRPKFIRIVDCQVCGDKANDHIHYGAIACYSCRAFFRRGVGASDQYQCTYGQKCKITLKSRKQCQYCRFHKCLEIGMKPTWVMTDEEKKEKREKTIKRKQLPPTLPKDKVQTMLGNETKTQYEDRMREERIQSRLARKRKPNLSGGAENSMQSVKPLSGECSSSSVHSSNPASNMSLSVASPIGMKFEPYSPLGIKFESYPTGGSVSPGPSCPPSSSMSDVTEKFEGDKDLPPLTPISIDDPVFEDIIDSPPAPMMLASAAAILYDWESQTKNEESESEPRSFSAELAKIAVIKQQRHAQMLAVLQRSPSWNITNEEKYFIQELCQLELNTSRSLPVPQNIMFMIINAARTGTAIPIEVAVQGYSICMQRVIKYASCMEFFNRLPEADRFKLLLKNVDMVVNIRTARLLRPDINLRDQLSHVVGWRERLRLGHKSSEVMVENSNAVVPMDTSGPSSSSQTPCKSTRDIKRLEVFQIFPTPWASDKHGEEQYEKLLRIIFELRMDHITTTLLTLMALFTDTETDKLTMPSEVNALQDHFTLLLSRYLCEQVGRSNATKLIPQYKSAIKSLQEMAHIFTQKRLKL